jgi:hypothetical protein
MRSGGKWADPDLVMTKNVLPITVPVSPSTALERYPCREVSLNYRDSHLFHVNDIEPEDGAKMVAGRVDTRPDEAIP